MSKTVKVWAVVDRKGNLLPQTYWDSYALKRKSDAMFYCVKESGDRVVPVEIVIKEKP